MPVIGGETRSRDIDFCDERDERRVIEGNVGEEGADSPSSGRMGSDEDVRLGGRGGCGSRHERREA